MHHRALSILCLSFCTCSGMAATAAACPGDLNADGIINSEDLGIILNAFGQSLAGDADCDGITDANDLGIVLGAFGQPCPVIVPDELMFAFPRSPGAQFDQPVAITYSVRQVLVGDLTGDGIDEIVTIHAGPSQNPEPRAVVTRRNAVGSLEHSLPVSTMAPGWFGGVHFLLDTNADALPDLVAVGSLGGNIAITINESLGDGSLGEPVTTTIETDQGVQWTGSTNTVVADVNGDGKPAIVFVGGSFTFSTISVLSPPAQPGGAWSFNTTNTTADLGTSITAGDVDGDGTDELIILSEDAQHVLIFISLGNGSFAEPIQYPLPLPGTFLDTADLNRNGLDDLVVSHQGSGSAGIPGGLSVHLANGTDGFEQLFVRERPPASNMRAHIADFDNDCALDILWAEPSESSSNQPIVLRNDGAGSFELRVPEGLIEWPEAAIDINGDGLTDAIHIGANIGYSAQPIITVQYNLGAVGFESTAPERFEPRLGKLVLSDINADGTEEIVGIACCIGGPAYDEINAFYIIPQSPDGGLLPTIRIDVDKAVGQLVDLACVDVTGNGLLDLIALASDAGFSTERLVTFVNTGNFTFESPRITPLPLAFSELARSNADINGDGLNDIVIGRGFASEPSSIQTLLSNGDGTYAMGPGIDLDKFPWGLTVEAINASGPASVLYEAQGELIIATLNAQASDFDLVSIPIDDNPPSLILSIISGGMTGDSIPDLVLLAPGDNPAIYVLPGDEAGGFGPPIKTPISEIDGTGTLGMGIADLDLDGSNDVVIQANAGIIVLMNEQGSGALTTQQSFAVSPELQLYFNVRGLVLIDTDGDGDLDIAVSETRSRGPDGLVGSLRVLENRTIQR